MITIKNIRCNQYSRFNYTFFCNKIVIGSKQSQLQATMDVDHYTYFYVLNYNIHREKFTIFNIELDELSQSKHTGNHHLDQETGH